MLLQLCQDVLYEKWHPFSCNGLKRTVSLLSSPHYQQKKPAKNSTIQSEQDLYFVSVSINFSAAFLNFWNTVIQTAHNRLTQYV